MAVYLITFRWSKLSATLTGNLLVLHVDCKEVARRKIALPNYCFGEEGVNINVGKGMKTTELGASGFSVRTVPKSTSHMHMVYKEEKMMME